MQPFIRPGDVAVVEPVETAGLLRRGDVLFYQPRPGVFRLHRFQRRADDGDPVLMVRGDAPGQAMERVSLDCVLGVLSTCERAGRVLNERRLLRRLAGLAWPRLRNRMRTELDPVIDKVCDKACDNDMGRSADPSAQAFVKEALKATLRGQGSATPAAGVEPPALVAAARRHGVLGLCAAELMRRCPAAEPAIREQLRAETLAGERGRARVAEALQALMAAGIRPLVVKGPALAALAYRDPSVRPYDDVDLLLAGPDRARALAVLEELGWRDSRNAPPLAQAHLLRTTEDLTLVHPGCDVGIDLVHPGGLLRDAAPSPDSPREAFDILGEPAQAPDKVEHFLYCAAHGAKHGYARWIWLADLDRLAATFSNADWRDVMDEASRRRLRRALALSLMLLVDDLGTPLGDAAREWLDAKERARSVQRAVAAVHAAQARGERHVETWRWWAALLDTPGQRARHAARWLFRPTGADLRSCLLPLRAHALYAVLRPLRLLTRLAFRRPAPKLTW